MFLHSIQNDASVFKFFHSLIKLPNFSGSEFTFNINHSICSVPWDQMILSGYFKSIFLCLFCGPAFFIVNFSYLPFFMGIGAHYPQLRYFFRDLIAQVGVCARNGSTEYGNAKKALFDAIEFHNDVKE